MMSDALSWAQAYAAHGLPLLPMKADKIPLTTHGLQDASCDPAIIEGWGRRWPFADWDWALPATVVAIDIDVKPGRNGYQDFKHRFEERGRVGMITAGPRLMLQTALADAHLRALVLWAKRHSRKEPIALPSARINGNELRRVPIAVVRVCSVEEPRS
jgi:Bifunctional DNA primase/polymerase, N-terminal